jgi:hypothetical protein
MHLKRPGATGEDGVDSLSSKRGKVEMEGAIASALGWSALPAWLGGIEALCTEGAAAAALPTASTAAAAALPTASAGVGRREHSRPGRVRWGRGMASAALGGASWQLLAALPPLRESRHRRSSATTTNATAVGESPELTANVGGVPAVPQDTENSGAPPLVPLLPADREEKNHWSNFDGQILI